MNDPREERLRRGQAALQNPDCQDLTELGAALRRLGAPERLLLAQALFPRQSDGFAAVCLVAEYAGVKLSAMKARWNGLIEAALAHEGVCERLYWLILKYALW